MEFTYRLIDSIILSSVALGLGLYTVRLNPKDGRNRLLFLICIWFVIRSTTALFAFTALKRQAEIVALFKINFFFYATQFSLNLHFFLLLRRRKLPAWTLALVYLPLLAAGLIALVDHQRFIVFVQREGEWRVRLPPRNARAWLYALNALVLLYLSAALEAAVLNLKRAVSNREKRQAAILLGGFLVYFVAQTVQPLLPRATAPSILVYPLFAYIISLSYATLRYRLLAPRSSPLTEDLIAHISDAVFLLDRVFAVSHVNSAAEKLLAAAPGTLRGRTFPSLVRGGELIAENLRSFQSGEAQSFTYSLAFANEGEDAAAACYLSKVWDRFGDLVGILVIAKELPGRREFRNRYRLTGREMEVIDLLLAGNSNETVGKTLGISERTVESHCSHVYSKLDAMNKTELIKLCAKYDLLP